MSYPVTIERGPRAAPALPWSTGWVVAEQLGDWRVAAANDATNPGGLSAERQLESAVIVSLFTDRRAPEGWRPDVADRRGWWGDGIAPEGRQPDAIGSHLWLLHNEVATPAVAETARLYAEAALAWLTEDRVAAAVAVRSGVLSDPGTGIWLAITISDRSGALAFDRRFERFWREI
jgi:phage gp46-like protein